VQAKLSAPHAVDALVGPALLRRFEECLQRRLTVVAAPAGYGKTTSTLTALGALALEHIWYKADVLDHDPAVIVLSLCEALQRQRPGFGELLRERLLHPSESPLSVEGMGAALVVELQESQSPPVHLVIDDYHDASDSPEFNRLLDYLVQNLPEAWRLVVLSRYEPGFETAKLRLARKLGQIGVEDLRFGETQVLEFMLRHSPDADRKLAAKLTELTEGWPAAVSLAAESLSWRGCFAVDTTLDDPRVTGDVYAYLMEQVYRRESGLVRTFLKRTAFLDSITPEIANRVSGLGNAHRHLDHLSKNRAFTFHVPGTSTYHYHKLFRDCLREACLREDGPEACRHYQLETANVLEEFGEIERAVELLISSGRPDVSLDVLRRGGHEALDNYRSEVLASWLRRLPEVLSARHPWAMLIDAQIRLRQGDFTGAKEKAREALRAFTEAGDEDGLYHALCTEETVTFWSGDIPGALRLARKCLDHATDPTQVTHTLNSIAAAAIQLRDWQTADEAWSDPVFQLAASGDDERERAAGLKASSLYYRGDFRLARSELEHLVAAPLPPTFRASALNALAITSLGLAEYKRAGECLVEAAHVADDFELGHFESLILESQAVLALVADHPETALMGLRSAMNSVMIRSDPSQYALTVTHLGTALRESGEPHKAAEVYRQALSGVDMDRDPYAHLNALVNREHCLGLAGNTAEHHLEELSEECLARGFRLPGWKSILFLADLEQRAGHDTRARELIARSVPVQIQYGHLHVLARELSARLELAELAVSADLGDEVLRELLGVLLLHPKGHLTLAALIRDDPDLQRSTLKASRERPAACDLAHVLRVIMRSTNRELREQAHASLTALRGSPGRESRECLSAREAQVLALMARGHRNDEIAKELFISPATVKSHVNHVFMKLGVKDRVSAVLLHEQWERDAAATPGRRIPPSG
jgi:DNA-binding CsgD family transcriptional regulator/tetratricopeptide (TPR) repeat protein